MTPPPPPPPPPPPASQDLVIPIWCGIRCQNSHMVLSTKFLLCGFARQSFGRVTKFRFVWQSEVLQLVTKFQFGWHYFSLGQSFRMGDKWIIMYLSSPPPPPPPFPRSVVFVIFCCSLCKRECNNPNLITYWADLQYKLHGRNRINSWIS